MMYWQYIEKADKESKRLYKESQDKRVIKTDARYSLNFKENGLAREAIHWLYRYSL